MSETEGKVKQVIVIRRDLRMRRGKEIAQGAHASVAWLAARIGHPHTGYPDFHVLSLNEPERLWLAGGSRKVTCQVPGEAEILALKARADELGIGAHVITDAGLTEFGGVPTVTAIGIGPDWDDRVDLVTGELQLY